MLLHEHFTERLRFRCLEPNDKAALLSFFTDRDSTQFLPIFDDVEDFTEEWLARQIRRYDLNGGGLYAIELKETGELVGQCGLIHQFVDDVPKWEVGYHFLRPFWGNGYATEAARACRDFCFENEMAETLISLIHPENRRSLKVAERNGMSHWKSTKFKGGPVEVMRIRREDWEAQFCVSA